jgi:hypothetical protein
MRGVMPAAYRLTRYQAGGAAIRIGRQSPAMDRLLVARRIRTATLITAYNPFSRRKPAGWNRRMQARLLEALRRQIVLPGHGTWRNWCEAHCCILGDARLAVRFARIFRQNAVVIVDRGRRARLVSIF